MKASEALQKMAEKWGYKPDIYEYKDEFGKETGVTITMSTWTEERDELLSDLTALISEHYVSKEDAGYPLEFIEWLIKDQEIFFGELNEEYILNDNIYVDGRKLQTIDELFNYWKENER